MLNRDVVSFPSGQTSGEPVWTGTKRKILEALEVEANRHLSLKSLCQQAGIGYTSWYKALKDQQFAALLTAMGVKLKFHWERHTQVHLATDPQEELVKDIWDIRRLKANYPKHEPPQSFKVDFTWIVNPLLRQQVKWYFRLRLTRWAPRTFKTNLGHMKRLLVHFPPEAEVSTLNREMIEVLLPQMARLSDHALSKCLEVTKAMFNYMVTSPAWTGARPPRFLIWQEDIPSLPETLPRPIPPEVLDQLDPLLEKAVEAMKQGETCAILSPMFWDAIHILRHTGMRTEDLAHLKALNDHGRNGCLDQDPDGDWWIRLRHDVSKMNRDHRIPTKTSDGVIEAVRRQQARITGIVDHFDEQYLFRYEKGVLSYEAIRHALKKLARHLSYEGKSYVIAPHQFRHSIATDMIETGVDIYTVKEFLGHRSLAMTEKYVKVYLSSLKAKYDAYRVKKQQTYASEMIANQVQVTQVKGDVDGGWVEGKVGKLYLSPLPDGAGNCAHLPMHDPCPDVPHCPTCPKLRATKRHLPMWENKVKNLRLTVEALRANPLYERARQKHEQELHHAEKVVETIQREGYWDGRIHNSKTNPS
jgi:site-specific recombinase XerD